MAAPNEDHRKINRDHDSIYSLDAHYHLAESDFTLEHIPHAFGTRRIGLAVIGLGRMGSIHTYNAIREPRANLLYILDANKEKLDYLHKKYFFGERGVKTIGPDQWKTVLEDKRVEAVLIATPTFLHEKYAREALEHGKHVLCEKPLAEKADAVASVLELAEKKNLTLMVAFNRRYDPSFRYVKEQAHRGDIGQIRVIKTCSRDSPIPSVDYIRVSGGIFHDCMVHDLDLVFWMAKELPIEVHSYATTYMEDYKEVGDYDTALAHLKFKSGLIASVELERQNASGYEQRIEVYGPKGVLKLDEMAHAGWEKHTDKGLQKPSNNYSFASRYREAYANEIGELFNHIEGNKTMEPRNLWYLNALIRVVNACERSAKEGCVVKIEWTEEEQKRPL